MVNFNGNVYSGNVIIVDGQVISGETVKKSSAKQFDETKKQSAEGIKRLRIDSRSVNVKLTTSVYAKEIIARLHGSTVEPDFSVSRHGDEVAIRVKANDSSISSSTVIMGGSIMSNCVVGGGNLELEIEVPVKMFEQISITSRSGSIQIASNVKTDVLKIENRSGSVKLGSEVVANSIEIENASGSITVSAAFQTLKVDAQSSSVNVASKLYCDVNLAIVMCSGNVDVELENLRNSYVAVETHSGRCKNNPHLNGNYTASGYIMVSCGNVKFH